MFPTFCFATNNRLLLSIAICAGTAFGGGSVQTLSLHIPNEVAPPGGMVQMKLLVTEPRPITSGSVGFSFDTSVFDGVCGIALFNPTGDVNGAAVQHGSRVDIRYTSTTGTSGTDYPIMSVAIAIRQDAIPGQKTQFALDPSSQWLLDLFGLVSLNPIPPATITVGGTISITDVTPGGGVMPPGSVITIHGIGFQPKTQVQLSAIKASSIQVVSPQEIDVTIAESVDLTGKKIQVVNPDGSQDFYFSYMRGKPLGTSAQPLLAATMPIFSSRTYTQAMFGPLATPGSGQFTGLAMQNQNQADVNITVQVYSASNALMGSSSFALPPSMKIERDLSEWVPASAPGGYVSVTASAPIQVFGLLGDTASSTVLPFRPFAATP